MGFGKCHLFFGCDIMKFFIIWLFLLLLFDSPQGSTVTQRPVGGLNTTLQTNFNGTYERRNPCNNAEIETSSYTASHEFRHHTKEDNWSDYSRRCSAIISGFLQAIGNLVRFNNKQAGTFNFHINTSISQKRDGECNSSEQKSCDALPTIIIQATDGEISPKLPTANAPLKPLRPCEKITEISYSIIGSNDGNKIRERVTSTRFPLNDGSQQPTTAAYTKPTTFTKSRERTYSASYATASSSKTTPSSFPETASYQTQPERQCSGSEGLMQQDENMSTPDMLLTGTQTAGPDSSFSPLLTDSGLVGTEISSPAVFNDLSSTTQSDFDETPATFQPQPENYVTSSEDELTTACSQAESESSSSQALENLSVNPQEFESISSSSPPSGDYQQGTQFNIPQTTPNLPIYSPTTQQTESETLSTENQFIQNQYQSSSFLGQQLPNAEQPYNNNFGEQMFGQQSADSSTTQIPTTIPSADGFNAFTGRTPEGPVGYPQQISPEVSESPNVPTVTADNYETTQGDDSSLQPLESSYTGTPFSPRVTGPVRFSQPSIPPYEENSFPSQTQSPNVMQNENFSTEFPENFSPFQQTKNSVLSETTSQTFSHSETQTEMQTTASTPEYDELPEQMITTQPPPAEDNLFTDAPFNYGGETQSLSEAYSTPTTPIPPVELPFNTLNDQNTEMPLRNTPAALPNEFPTETPQFSEPTPIPDSTFTPQSDFSSGPSSNFEQPINDNRFSDSPVFTPDQEFSPEQTQSTHYNQFTSSTSSSQTQNFFTPESQLTEPPFSGQNLGEQTVNTPFENSGENYPVTPDQRTPQRQQPEFPVTPQYSTVRQDFFDTSSPQEPTGNFENTQFPPDMMEGEMTPNQFQTFGPDSSERRETPNTFITPSTQFRNTSPFRQFPTMPEQQPIGNYEMSTLQNANIDPDVNDKITTPQWQSSQGFGNDRETELTTSNIFDEQTPNTFVQPDSEEGMNAPYTPFTSTFSPVQQPVRNYNMQQDETTTGSTIQDSQSQSSVTPPEIFYNRPEQSSSIQSDSQIRTNTPFDQFPPTSSPQQEPLGNYETTESQWTSPATYSGPALQTTAGQRNQPSDLSDAMTGFSEPTFYGQQTPNTFPPTDLQFEANGPFTPFRKVTPEQQPVRNYDMPQRQYTTAMPDPQFQSSPVAPPEEFYNEQDTDSSIQPVSQPETNVPFNQFPSTPFQEEQSTDIQETTQSQSTSTASYEDSLLQTTAGPGPQTSGYNKNGVTGFSDSTFYDQQTPNSFPPTDSQFVPNGPFTPFPPTLSSRQQPIGNQMMEGPSPPVSTSADSQLQTSAIPQTQPSVEYGNDRMTTSPGAVFYTQQTPNDFVQPDSQLRTNAPVREFSTVSPQQQPLSNYEMLQSQSTSPVAFTDPQTNAGPEEQLSTQYPNDDVTEFSDQTFYDQQTPNAVIPTDSQVENNAPFTPEEQGVGNYYMSQEQSTSGTTVQDLQSSVDPQFESSTIAPSADFYNQQDQSQPDAQFETGTPFNEFPSTLSTEQQPVEYYEQTQDQSTTESATQDDQLQTSADRQFEMFYNQQDPNSSIQPDSQLGTDMPFDQFPSTSPPQQEPFDNYETTQSQSMYTDSPATTGAAQPSVQYPNEEAPGFSTLEPESSYTGTPFSPRVTGPVRFSQSSIPPFEENSFSSQTQSSNVMQNENFNTESPENFTPFQQSQSTRLQDTTFQTFSGNEMQTTASTPEYDELPEQMTTTQPPPAEDNLFTDAPFNYGGETQSLSETATSFVPNDSELAENESVTPFAPILSPVQQPVEDYDVPQFTPTPAYEDSQLQSSAGPESEVNNDRAGFTESQTFEQRDQQFGDNSEPSFYGQQTSNAFIPTDYQDNVPLTTVATEQQPIDDYEPTSSDNYSITTLSPQVEVSNQSFDENFDGSLPTEERMSSETSDMYPSTVPMEYEPSNMGPVPNQQDTFSPAPGSSTPYGAAPEYAPTEPTSFAPEMNPNYSQTPNQFEQGPYPGGVSRGTQTDFSQQPVMPYGSENAPLMNPETTFPPVTTFSEASSYSEVTSDSRSRQFSSSEMPSSQEPPRQTQNQFFEQPSGSGMTSSIPEITMFDAPSVTTPTPFNDVSQSQSRQDPDQPLGYPNQMLTYSNQPQSLDQYSGEPVTVSGPDMFTQSPDVVQNENQPFTPAPSFSSEPEQQISENQFYSNEQTSQVSDATTVSQQSSVAPVNIPSGSEVQQDSTIFSEQLPYFGTTAIPAGPQGNAFTDYNNQLTSAEYGPAVDRTTMPQEFRYPNQMSSFSPDSPPESSVAYPPPDEQSTEVPFQSPDDSFVTPQATLGPNSYVSYGETQPNSPPQSESLISTVGNDQPLSGTFQPSYVPESQTETTLPYSNDPSVDMTPSFDVSEQGPLDAPLSTTPQWTGSQNIKPNDFQAFSQPENISPGYPTSVTRDYVSDSDSSTFPTFPSEPNQQLDTSLSSESTNNQFLSTVSTPSAPTYNPETAYPTQPLNPTSLPPPPFDYSEDPNAFDPESQPTDLYKNSPNYYSQTNEEYETSPPTSGTNLPLNYPEQIPVETTLPPPYADEINQQDLKSQNVQEEMPEYLPSLAPQPQPQPSLDYTTEISDYETNESMGQTFDNTTPSQLNPEEYPTNSPTGFQPEFPTPYTNDQGEMNTDFPLSATQPEEFDYAATPEGYPQSDNLPAVGTTDRITDYSDSGLTTADTTSTSYQTFPTSTIKSVAPINPGIPSYGPYETLPTSENIDNVSPQFQPTTAVNYNEETNAYQTTPAPQPQTTMKYVDRLSDENTENFTSDQLETTSPDFGPTPVTTYDQFSPVISQTTNSDRSNEYESFTETQQFDAMDSQTQYTSPANEQTRGVGMYDSQISSTDYPMSQDFQPEMNDQAAENNIPLYNNQENFQTTENQEPQTTPVFYGQYPSTASQTGSEYLNSAATPEYPVSEPEEPVSYYDQQTSDSLNQFPENQAPQNDQSQNYEVPPISDAPFDTTQGVPFMNYDKPISAALKRQPTNPSYSTASVTKFPPTMDYSNRPDNYYTSGPIEPSEDNQPQSEITPQPNFDQRTESETFAYTGQNLNDGSTPPSDSLISSPSSFETDSDLTSDYPSDFPPTMTEPDTQPPSFTSNIPMSSPPTFEQQTPEPFFDSYPENSQTEAASETAFPEVVRDSLVDTPMPYSDGMSDNDYEFVPTEQGTTPAPVYSTTESSSYSSSQAALYNVRNRPNGRLFDGKDLPFQQVPNENTLPPTHMPNEFSENPEIVENPTSSSSLPEYEDYSTDSPTTGFTEYGETASRNQNVMTDEQAMDDLTTEQSDVYSSQPEIPQTDSPLDFEEGSTSRPMIFSSEPPMYPQQQQHSNPLLQTLESHMSILSQPSTTTSFPESSLNTRNTSPSPADSFSFEPQDGISSVPTFIPRREFDQNFTPSQPQPNAGVYTPQDVTMTPQPNSPDLVSDLTTPSNIPDRTTTRRFGYMSRPLRNPMMRSIG